MTSSDITKIAEAIVKQDCVLFIGPDILKNNGKDFQASFYETLLNKDDAKYDVQEKLWSFRSISIRRKIIKDMSEFYKINQQTKNETLTKLAAIPFHLIVSLIPDNTIDTVYSTFNIGQNFDYFKRERSDCAKPSKEQPLIYNLFGNIENRDYVLTYQDFQVFSDAIVTIGLPNNLKDTLIQANYYVFIGFEFDKWYNILLLYILNSIKATADKFAIEDHNIQTLLNKLLDENLNVNFEESADTLFVDRLYEEVKKQGCLRKLETEFEKLGSDLNEKREMLAFMKDSLATTVDIKQKFSLKKDIAQVEKEIEELINQIKNTQ